MTLPASGNIDLQQILAEFGAPAGTGLAAMVRGGAYVPNIPQNANVPTAPPIGMTSFYGASNVPPVSISNQFASGGIPFEGTPPADPDAEPQAGEGTWGDGIAQYYLRSDGIAQIEESTGIFGAQNNVTLIPNEWLAFGSASSYEVLATLTGGSGGFGTFGSWLNLGTGRAWGVQGSFNKSITFTVQIRPAGGGAVLDTATITCEITR